MSEVVAKKSEVSVRVASAVVMATVAGTALWLGGWYWIALAATIATGVLYEWFKLARAFCKNKAFLVFWLLAGFAYVGFAAYSLIEMRGAIDDVTGRNDLGGLVDLWPNPSLRDIWGTLTILLAVIAVDVGAFFVGRAVGGPKIAPKISPSKTWAGAFGGAIAAGTLLSAMHWFFVSYIELCDFPSLCDYSMATVASQFLIGSIVTVVAQSGDFLESWMKRKAGVKDSGSLIPGHGGLFDRVDGIVAVSCVIGIFVLIIR